MIQIIFFLIQIMFFFNVEAKVHKPDFKQRYQYLVTGNYYEQDQKFNLAIFNHLPKSLKYEQYKNGTDYKIVALDMNNKNCYSKEFNFVTRDEADAITFKETGMGKLSGSPVDKRLEFSLFISVNTKISKIQLYKNNVFLKEASVKK